VSRARVKLSELLLAVEHISVGGLGDARAYLAFDTGATHVVDECSSSGPDDLSGDTPPPAIEDPTRYLHLPTKADLGLGKRLAVRFAWAHLEEKDAHEVEAYFRRNGAYANFKALLERRHLLQQWYEHEARALREELLAWCETNDLELIDDQGAR
jgi:Uncharacterised protein family (UPF0158)